MSSFEKVAEMWRRAEMTPKKAILIILALIVFSMLADGYMVGSQSGTTITKNTTTPTATSTASTTATTSAG